MAWCWLRQPWYMVRKHIVPHSPISHSRNVLLCEQYCATLQSTHTSTRLQTHVCSRPSYSDLLLDRLLGARPNSVCSNEHCNRALCPTAGMYNAVIMHHFARIPAETVGCAPELKSNVWLWVLTTSTGARLRKQNGHNEHFSNGYQFTRLHLNIYTMGQSKFKYTTLKIHWNINCVL